MKRIGVKFLLTRCNVSMIGIVPIFYADGKNLLMGMTNI